MRPRTTICCTVGPASREPAVLQGLVAAGARVFRLNGALVAPADLGDWVARIRGAAEASGVEVGVLLDLPGTGLRLGALADGGARTLTPGQRLRIDDDEAPSGPGRLSVPALHLLADAEVGQALLLGDGGQRLEVVGRSGEALEVVVREGGEVRTGTSLHAPGLSLPTSVPTSADRALLAAGLEAEVDMVAQSFVRTDLDVARLKEALAGRGGRGVLALAKIERVEAVDAIERIVDRADGVVVARGDLAIDAGIEHVPGIQRRVVEAGRRGAKPVLIATEMLASMTRSARPTRAETSDVAGAVFEGADGVLLSAETALGVDPVRATVTMARILTAAESEPDAPHAGAARLEGPVRRAGRPDQHVVRAAVDLARDVGARAIVAWTRQGSSAFRLSKERPQARILALTPSPDVVRRLTLAWGVEAVRVHAATGTDDLLAVALEHLREGGYEHGDVAVAVMGGARDPAGATTLIKLLHL